MKLVDHILSEVMKITKIRKSLLSDFACKASISHDLDELKLSFSKYDCDGLMQQDAFEGLPLLMLF